MCDIEEIDGIDERRPCVCCGHLTFSADSWPGSFNLCPVCFWEDDLTQLEEPFYEGGANTISLAQAQVNYQAFGACDKRGIPFVKPATRDQHLCRSWRVIDQSIDDFSSGEIDPTDWRTYCWWMPQFRNKQKGESRHEN